MIIDVFFEGVVLGAVISITIGPAFFAIIQTGIYRGFYPGMIMAMGIFLSDVTLIAICYLGASVIFDDPDNKLYIGLVGGVLLIIFGLVTYNRKPDVLIKRSGNFKTPTKQPGFLTYFFKGYFLNILNPFLFVFWLTAMGWVSSNAEEGMLLHYTIIFFSGTLATVFVFDLIKAFIGKKIAKYLRPRLMLWINRIVGLLLLVFGIILIVRSVILWL